MNDRELLELAAKAAGLNITHWAGNTYAVVLDGESTLGWDPLNFDSDALRLAVKLKIEIAWDAFQEPEVMAAHEDQWWLEPYGDDPYAATRRAIVRAAAEIGKGMR